MTALQTTIEKSQALRDTPPKDTPPPQEHPQGRAGTAQWLALPELWLDPAHLRAQRIVTLTPDAAASPYDTLRTRLLRMAGRQGWKRIALVSPAPAAGKTTTLVNLAFALGRQPRLRVMALDFNLRRPTMGRILGARVPLNMGDLICGQGYMSSVLRRHGPGLAFGLNDGSIEDTAELLQCAEAADLTVRFETEFNPDLMFFDLANLSESDDALAFLPNVDAALIVVEAGRHSAFQIDMAERQVAELTTVAGIVLNRCSLLDSPFGPPRSR